MRLTGAQIIIHLLERQEITTIAGIPGGANLPLYDALSQSRKIRHVLAPTNRGPGLLRKGWRVLAVNRPCVLPPRARALPTS